MSYQWMPGEPITPHHHLRVDVRPVPFQADQIRNPGTDIATLGAGLWGVIPFIGDAIAVLLILVGGVVHLLRRSKQKRRSREVLDDPDRPWEWAVLARGPDPASPYQPISVSGDGVRLLGLPPTASGSARVKGIEPTKERATAKAEHAHQILTDLIR